MKQYELLCVLRGTLSEEEVTPVMEKVTSIITTQEGSITSVNDMGKRRIAYPIKHIRYGYYHLVFFQVAAENVPAIQEKLRLIPELLRGIVRIHVGEVTNEPKVGAVIDEIVRHDDMDRSERRDRRHKKSEAPAASAPAAPAPAQEGAAASEESSTEDKKEEQAEEASKESSISMKDIDKKLDEILQSDLDKV